MTIPRSYALSLALAAVILSALVAHAVPRNTSIQRPIASALPAPLDTAPAVNTCNAERAELASIKLRLATCIAISMRAPNAAPPDSREASTPDPSEPPEVGRNRELLENDSEAVIVRRADGTIGVYKPEEWPSDGDGLIIGRKFPDGEIGWYGPPTAKGRAMFWAPIRLKPDGTLTLLGKPAPPWVIRRLGGKVDAPDTGQGASEPPAASTPATPP